MSQIANLFSLRYTPKLAVLLFINIIVFIWGFFPSGAPIRISQSLTELKMYTEKLN